MLNLATYTFLYSMNAKLLSTENYANGNMGRTTAEMLLLATDELSSQLKEEYKAGLNLLRVGHLKGALTRKPNTLENTSVDDYLVAGSDEQLARAFLAEARSNMGALDVNGEWSWVQWIFRFQGMWQHLRISARENVGVFGQLMWALSIWLAARQPIDHQDNWVLSHIMILTKEKRGFKSWICDKAVQYWKSKKTLPTSEIMRQYLNVQDHPLIKLWEKYE